jgi:siroheme synthase-like protein
MLPVFLKLEGRRVLLVGAGPIAVGKLSSLLAEGARVTVVAPEVRPEIEQAAKDSGVEIRRRGFEPGDVDGVWWIVAAAPPDINRNVLGRPRHVACS